MLLATIVITAPSTLAKQKRQPNTTTAATTYFRNATGVYDNTILQGKGGYFSNETGSYLQLPNSTITNSPATELCNIMTQVYRSQFPTQCWLFASPFIR